MAEHPARKIQNKHSKYSQYSKGLKKDTEKMQFTNDCQNNLLETVSHRTLILVYIQTGGIF